jgi:hypothetical protein
MLRQNIISVCIMWHYPTHATRTSCMWCAIQFMALVYPMWYDMIPFTPLFYLTCDIVWFYLRPWSTLCVMVFYCINAYPLCDEASSPFTVGMRVRHWSDSDADCYVIIIKLLDLVSTYLWYLYLYIGGKFKQIYKVIFFLKVWFCIGVKLGLWH